MQKSPTLSLMVALATAATSLLVRPAPAYACSCSRPGVEVSPGAGAPAPTNTVVRVSWWIGQVKLEESTLQIVAAEAAAAEAKSRSKKKRRGKDKEPEAEKAVPAVELEVSGITSGQVRTLTLRPKAPLVASTRYEVRVASTPGEKVGVIGEFTTGPAADDKPPEWAGTGKASFVHEPAVCCNCSTGDPYVQLDLGDAGKVSDDATPAAALVYAVWLDDGSKLEAGAAPASPPLLLTRAWSGKIYLGHKSICSPTNFDLSKPGALKLRVAPVDLAGHVGKIASLSVDVPALKAKPPAKK